MYSACAVPEALEAFVPRDRLANSGRTAVDLGASEDLRFSVLECQGISSATVDIIVTMGSYRALL